MTIQAKFAGRCSRCGRAFEAGTSIEWDRFTRSTSHSVCPPPQPKAEPAVQVTNLRSVADFIGAARERGLKYPQVRFLAPGCGELRLGVAGAQSKVPGAINVKINGDWIGRVHVDGEVYGPLAQRDDVVAALKVIGEDPVSAAKAYAALTCQCSFCGTNLTDEGSVEVGYGPICAKRFGLPHTPKGTKAVGAAPQAAVTRDSLGHEPDEWEVDALMAEAYR